ncbi:MAG: hypothetical protein Kow0025_02080 [Thermodesulfovibrionales bacterium]
MGKRLTVKERIAGILSMDETPHRVAAAVAVGVFFGISPFIGLHTVLALLVAWMFRLNRLAVLPGVFVTNPWSIIPIYTFCIWVGSLILGVEIELPDIDWKNVTLSSMMIDLSDLVMPFFVGSMAVAFAVAFVCYAAVRVAAGRRRS